MRLDNVVKILKVINKLEEMPMVGEGTTRPTIVFYSGVPQSTVYRYLDILENEKLVTVKRIENRNNLLVGYYKMTDIGRGYILKDERLIR